jgi:RNA polymerase sigma-70 factor (ECF subfamily)
MNAATNQTAGTNRSRDQIRFGAKEREYVFSVAMKYVKDREEAADVAQDAMILAWRYQDGFRGDSQFTTWLYRIAATTALMHLRKKKRQPVLLTLLPGGASDSKDERDLLAQAPTSDSSPEARVIAKDEVERVRERLGEMGEKYGKVFMMRFAEGYTETEVAKKLKVNVGTVKTRAYRSRAAVRARLRGTRAESEVAALAAESALSDEAIGQGAAV